jgi:hypothetical protein
MAAAGKLTHDEWQPRSSPNLLIQQTIIDVVLQKQLVATAHNPLFSGSTAP